MRRDPISYPYSDFLGLLQKWKFFLNRPVVSFGHLDVRLHCVFQMYELAAISHSS